MLPAIVIFKCDMCNTDKNDATAWYIGVYTAILRIYTKNGNCAKAQLPTSRNVSRVCWIKQRTVDIKWFLIPIVITALAKWNDIPSF